MRVNISDMTGRDRIVLTREQLLAFLDQCDLNIIGGTGRLFTAKLDWPDVIEVEEVIGE